MRQKLKNLNSLIVPKKCKGDPLDPLGFLNIHCCKVLKIKARNFSKNTRIRNSLSAENERGRTLEIF